MNIPENHPKIALEPLSGGGFAARGPWSALSAGMPSRSVLPVILTLLAAALAVVPWPRERTDGLALMLAGLAVGVGLISLMPGRRKSPVRGDSDVTRLRESEAALRVSESRMAALLE